MTKLSKIYPDLHNGANPKMRVLNQLNFEYLLLLKQRYHLDFQHKNFLDIGIGEGILAQKIVHHFQPQLYLGIDFDNFIPKENRHQVKFKKINLNLQNDIAKFIEDHTGKFEVINVFDVLEHIIYYDYLLMNIHKLLSSRGILILSLPLDLNLWTKVKIFFKEDLFFNEDSIHGHINFFSLNILFRQLKRISKMKLINMKKCGLGYGLYDKKFHLDLIAKIIPSLSSRIYICLQKS